MIYLDKSITDDYGTKLNGFRISHRNRWKLTQEDILNTQELILLEHLIDFTDPFPNHKTYGLTRYDKRRIADYLKWTKTTVDKWFNKLISLKFIESTNVDGVFVIPNIKRYYLPIDKGNCYHFVKMETSQSGRFIADLMTYNKAGISDQSVAPIETKKLTEQEQYELDCENIYQILTNSPQVDNAIAIDSCNEQYKLLVDGLETRSDYFSNEEKREISDGILQSHFLPGSWEEKYFADKR